MQNTEFNQNSVEEVFSYINNPKQDGRIIRQYLGSREIIEELRKILYMQPSLVSSPALYNAPDTEGEPPAP